MMKKILILGVILGAVVALPFGAAAQGLPAPADTAAFRNSLNLHVPAAAPGIAFDARQIALTKNFSLQTTGFPTHLPLMSDLNEGMTGNPAGMNPSGMFRRPDIGFRGLLFNAQNFSVGASYNGLNNLMRSGFSGDMNESSRNNGFSIHAGIHF
jgi:hypothetical protein